LAAFISLLVFVPSFFNNSPGANTAGAERQPTSRPTLTPLSTPTKTSTPPVALATAPPQRLTPFPTPQPNTQVFEFVASPDQSGWTASGESALHFGDRNLHAGSFKGQIFQSLIVFDMPSLAPGSKVRYAQVELTGLNRNNIAAGGTWTLQLLASVAANRSADLGAVPAQASIGAPLTTDRLAEGQVNQFIFTVDQLSLLDDALNGTGKAYFRLSGPTSSDNLFTWDGGDRDPTIGAHPILRLIAAPSQYTVITNTPTPQNVLTAAAVLLRGTEIARRGTPTALPRVYATATPLVIVTGAPTPANGETATAVSAYATAIALTTGTYTPTPPNWITATPIPLFIAVETPTLAATPAPTLSKIEIARKSFPPGLLGKIMFLSGSRDAPTAFIMDANGKNVFQITDSSIYDLAATRDAFSPSGVIEAFNAPDRNNPDLLQIFLFDHSIPGSPLIPNYNQVTFLRRGIAFAPSWSPDSSKIAYTSTESGKHEIVAVDVDTKRPTQLTVATGWNFNQFPSWSPDGKQIVYASDRARPNTYTEIWVMNSDGSGPFKLLDWGRDAWSPIWIKWAK